MPCKVPDCPTIVKFVILRETPILDRPKTEKKGSSRFELFRITEMIYRDHLFFHESKARFTICVKCFYLLNLYPLLKLVISACVRGRMH